MKTGVFCQREPTVRPYETVKRYAAYTAKRQQRMLALKR